LYSSSKTPMAISAPEPTAAYLSGMREPDVLGSLIPDKYAAVGSGAEIAIGVLEEEYKENMSMEEAKQLTARAIKSAISRDVMSGDGVDFLMITKDGIKEESMKF